MYRAPGVAVLVLFAATAARGQAPAPAVRQPGPARDTVTAGKAVVRGRALLADADQPLRRAAIQLSSESGVYRGALTDDEGRYEFRDLPAGQYSLMARKEGFVPVVSSQRRRVEQQRPIRVADAEVLDRIDFLFVRGGVITGRVLDDLGEPAIRAGIELLRPRYANGERTLQSAAYGQTDDHGEFRVFGIAPGEYFVGATYHTGAGDATDGRVEFARTLYPGTTREEDAQRVAIPAGGEVAGITLSLQRTRTNRIQGTIKTGLSRSLNTFDVRLVRHDRSGAVSTVNSTFAQADGSFTLTGVLPGNYQLIATDLLDDGSMSARLDVTVGTEDLAGVVLTPRPGVTARGRVRFDVPQRAVRPDDLRLLALPIEDQQVSRRNLFGPKVAADWTFEIANLAGRHMILAVLLDQNSSWNMKSLRVGGVDVTDTGIDFEVEDVDGIEIVLSQKQTSLGGRVTNGDGQIVAGARVVLFAENPDRWSAHSRWIAADRPDQYGRYTLTNHPAGRYRVVAVDMLEDGEEFDPDLLESLRERATVVELVDDVPKTVDLKVVER
jgi:protocatechuate 3,4-dioxygenase beta subunit